MSFLRTVLPSWRWFAMLIFCVGCASILSGCFAQQRAGLQVITADVGADILLDGKQVGTTPYLNKELKNRTYQLEIRPHDAALIPYQTQVTLKKGLLTIVTWKPGSRPETSGGVIYEMSPLRRKESTELAITTIPDGAIITVDGESKGFAPVLADQLSPGEHRYEVSLPSYETQRNTINVLAGYRMSVTVKLAKQDWSQLETASGSAVPTPLHPDLLSATASAQPATASAQQTPTVAFPKVQIKSTGYFVGGKEGVRIRQAASASSPELGFALVGAEYPYRSVQEDGWYNITFQNQSGWVTSQYAKLITQ